MKFSKLLENKVYRNLILMLLLGMVSYLFGYLKFRVPELSAIEFDFREIPLLISVFYFRYNPLYLMGISLITAFNSPSDNYIITNFVMHFVSLISVWYIYKKILTFKFNSFVVGIIWFVVVALIYYPIIIVILVISNAIVGIEADLNYITHVISKAWFEILISSLISSLFVIQHLIRLKLEINTENLEKIVKARTEELSTIIEQLKSTRQELIQSEKMSSLKVLTAGITHEINNPLNFINGAMHMMTNIEDKIENKNLRKDWKTINLMLNSGYERIYKIVHDLTHFTTDNNDDYKSRDLHKIIGMALLLIKPTIPKGVRVKTNYRLKSTVPIFSEKMHQVLLNLIHNAIQATNIKNNKKRLIEISTYENNSHAYIEIFNTGKNIPKNLLNKIFDPFFTTKSPKEGTGLGLSICYTIIKANHNGNISVENINNGVKFIVELPLNHEL